MSSDLKMASAITTAAAAATATARTEADFSSSKRPYQDVAAGAAADDGHDDEEEGELLLSSSSQYRNLAVYGEHKRAVSSVKMAPSRLCQKNGYSTVVASASADGTCKLWDVKTEFTDDHNNDDDDYVKSSYHSQQLPPKGNYHSKPNALSPLATCVGHSRGINEVSWNPVSPILATASDDKTVRLWDAVTAEVFCELRGHDNFVFCLDQHQSTIVTGSFDETVKLWDIRTGDCVATLPAHSDPVTAVSFHRDGTTVVSASHDGLIRLWDVATGECLKTVYAAGNPPVATVRYSPNGKYVLAGTLDSTLRLWPVVGGGTMGPTTNTHHAAPCTKTYRDTRHFVNTKYSIVADFTCHGNVVVGSEAGNVVVFDLQSGETLQVLGPRKQNRDNHHHHNNNNSSSKVNDNTNDNTHDNNHDNNHNDNKVNSTDHTDHNNNSNHCAAVLAVSAHDQWPLLATSADRKVEFWSAMGSAPSLPKQVNDIETSSPPKKRPAT